MALPVDAFYRSAATTGRLASPSHCFLPFLLLSGNLLTEHSEALPFLGQIDVSSDQYGYPPIEQRPPPGFGLDHPRRATPTLPPGLPIPPGFQPATTEPEHTLSQTNQRQTIAPFVLSTPTPASKSQSKPKFDIKPDAPRPSSPTPAEAAAKLNQVEKPTPTKVIPAVPVLPERAPTPKKQDTEPAIPTNVSDSLSQQAPSLEKGANVKTSTPLVASQPAKVDHGIGETETEKLNSKLKDTTSGKINEKPASKRPHPGKLDISKATPLVERDFPSSAASAPAKPESLARKRAPSLTSSAPSRPGTPGAIATGSPLRRSATQPRTLRITGTPSTETPPLLPSTAATSSSTPTAQQATTPAAASGSKVSSRRPSVTSLNAPGTPLSEQVDSNSVVSASASRASSPPPITTNKKAEKKSRKQKQKQSQVDVDTIPTKAPVEEQAPIVSRKKKTKKPSESPAPKRTVTSTSTPQISRPTSPKPTEKGKDPESDKLEEDEQKENVEDEESRELLEEPVTPREPEPSPAEASTTTGAEREKEKSQTAAAILHALESTHQLALSTLSLLKPLTEIKSRNWLVDQNSSSSVQAGSSLTGNGALSFTTADLHNHLDQLSFEISRAEAELLKQGEALRKDAGDGRVSGRNLVTSDGMRFSCLSKEEEDRVIALTKAIAGTKGAGKWRPFRNAKGMAMAKVRIEGEAPPASLQPPLPSTSSSSKDDTRASTTRQKGIKEGDISAYTNAFIPPSSDFLLPNTSTGLLSSSNEKVGRSERDPTFTTEAYQRAEQVLENVTRQIEYGIKAAQGRDPNEAIGELANRVNKGIEKAISAYGDVSKFSSASAAAAAAAGAAAGAFESGAGGSGVGGAATRKERLGVKEAEQLLVEARKAAEVWERKLNAVVKRNRKMVFGGRE